MPLSTSLRSFFKTPENKLLTFFIVLFLILVVRLFWIQIVQGSYYQQLLLGQHTTTSTLEAKRGHIYVQDKAGTHMQLTDNVDLFTLFIDPKYMDLSTSIYAGSRTASENSRLEQAMKDEIITLLTPIITDHLCVQYGVQMIDKNTCIQNIQTFTRRELLPDPNTYYTFSGNTLLYTDNEDYLVSVQEVEESFSREVAESLVTQRLEDIIRNGIRETNYLGWYDDPELISTLQSSSVSDAITIIDDAYIYVSPGLVDDPQDTAELLHDIFAASGISYSKSRLLALMNPQEIRYIRIATGINSKIARKLKQAKEDTYQEGVNSYGVPLLHGVGLEQYQERYYPHGQFMANILGYVTGEGESYYGVEEYFDELLGGKDGQILGMATPWIGKIGANAFEISQPVDGSDITLTIDPVIQREIENTANFFTESFRADSIAITVLDPHTGEIQGLANSPSYDPNDFNASYKLRPIQYDERYLLEDTTFTEIPVFTLSGSQLIQTTTETRNLPGQRKYIFQNYLGPQVFVDKNISFPYEPGSIFKTITLAIGVDSDSINTNEFYQDDGKVTIGPFTISNVSSKCLGYNTFSHALGFSCNVGMVRIAQRVTKYVFYEYLQLLGFGQLTGVELAGEQGGSLPDFNTVSVARYFNNTYGQGILATPLQMAVAYAAVVNGGTYIQPTIVQSIYNPTSETYQTIRKKERITVFDEQTSQSIKDSLVDVFDTGGLQKYQKQGYSLGGKTGTSEIAFRGKYQGGAGWTNGSFVGLVTAETSNYVIAIQVRRPRSSPWGSDTAGRIFSQLADFLITYDAIDE